MLEIAGVIMQEVTGITLEFVGCHVNKKPVYEGRSLDSDFMYYVISTPNKYLSDFNLYFYL